jgi:hypothetical protein
MPTVHPTATLKAGTVLRVAGVDVELFADTVVRVRPSEAEALRPYESLRRHPEAAARSRA